MSWTLNFANSPTGSNSLGNVDNEIRQLKQEIKTFMSRDHYFEVAAGQTETQLARIGRLRPGSAKLQSLGGFGFPTVRPDGTSFDENDDGRIVWAQGALQGLGAWVGYWNDTAMGWWPMSTEAVGSVKAHYGAYAFNQSQPTNIALNTYPGWVPCDGTITVATTITYQFGMGRSITVSVPALDWRKTHMRGAEVAQGTVLGGSMTPVLTAPMLPIHAHPLSTANVAFDTLPSHPRTDIPDRGTSGTIGSGSNANWYTAVTDVQRLQTPVLSHSPITLGAASRTDDYGLVTPNGVAQQQYQEVTWFLKVL